MTTICKSVVTSSQLIAKVRELAKKYPDAVYQVMSYGCKYTQGQVAKGPIRCGCIIGQALVELDPTLGSKLSEIDMKSSMRALGICQRLNIHVNIVEGSWLDKVQNEQDRRTIWSECVETADRLYSLT